MDPIILINTGDFAEFEYTTGLQNVVNILSFSDEIEGTSNVLKEFQWSTDKKSWSSWQQLNTINLQAISPIDGEPMYFNFKYTLAGPKEVKIISITLHYNTSDLTDGTITADACCVEVGSTECIVSSTSCESDFNPYLVNPALDMFAQLVDSVNSKFGIPAKFFKATADKRSEDVIFMEQSLFGVDECKDIKIMLENNEFPDSMPTYNQWGIDFEHPFEVHIVKTYFQKIYGPGTAPQKRDIIYIPMMNRLFDVVSSYMFKDFMQRDSYWKVNLRKHQEKSNVYKGDTAQSLIAELTTGTEKIMGAQITNDLKDITNNQQIARTVGTGVTDPTRFAISEDLKFGTDRIDNFGTVISDSYYEHYRNVSMSAIVKNVEYKEFVKSPINDEFSFVSWFKHHDISLRLPSDSVRIITRPTATSITFALHTPRPYVAGSLIEFTRGNISLYGTVTSVSNGVYTLEIPTKVIKDIESFDPSWSARFDWKCQIADVKNLINGTDGDKGIKISLVSNRFVVVKLNTSTYITVIDYMLNKSVWHGIVINVSKKYKEISIDVWRPNDATDLKNIFSGTTRNIVNEDTSADVRYSLLASPMLQTNIRLFNERIEKSKQSNMLSQQIIKESSKAIIIDNAIKDMQLPYLGNGK